MRGHSNNGGDVLGRGRMRMADLARIAGVSTSTVSRALADSPLIPAALRDKIVALAQAHGYVVNQSARSLRLRRNHTIGVVIPLGHESGQLISDPFFLEMIGHLADAITARDYEILLTKVAKPTSGWLDRIIQAHRADGLLIIGQSDQHLALNGVAESYRPMVVWGGRVQDQRYCTVGVDNIGGARLAVEHLIKQGRRRIAFLGVPELPEVGLRQQGYMEALADAGLSAPSELIAPAHFTTDTASSTVRNLIDSGADFDAIFAASDVIALTAIQALRASGRLTPDDVSVVGFDDIALAGHSEPPLTTVRQNLAEGARLMVDLLFRRMVGEDAPSATLAPELIVRRS
jgi:DNA-binding LacI/PurR family transcriptional regulator